MIFSIFEGRFLLMRLLLLTAAMLLVCISVLTIYAIGHPVQEYKDTGTQEYKNNAPGTDSQASGPRPQVSSPNKYSNKWKKQLAYAGAGVFCLVLVNLFDYRHLGPISYLLYGLILFLLAIILVDKEIFTIPFVHDRLGMHRWIKIGFGFLIQPSEFCKVAYILALTWYLRFRSNYRTFAGLIGPFALTLLAMVLILLEPDLGTTVLLMPVLFTMLFVAGARVKHLVIILCIGLAVSPIMWKSMKSYQRMRISSVLLQNDNIFAAAQNHEKLAKILVGDPDNLRSWKGDEGFQLLHAKRAIASGGLCGYGFGKGPYLETAYAHLPEADNDMIFPMIAHQFGALGCGVLLMLYITIIACAIELAWLNTDPFGRLVAVGIATMFAVQVLVNVGMTLGLMPITGLTLPLVSYGGSSMVANLIAIGLLNNIGKHRPFSVAKKPFEFG
ncbi:MAG: FtsW/RodA/SpoVE family cell cycle protein [Planctomycetota bacterium]|jgi:cell division protein FtsW (lipid II flippase)